MTTVPIEGIYKIIDQMASAFKYPRREAFLCCELDPQWNIRLSATTANTTSLTPVHVATNVCYAPDGHYTVFMWHETFHYDELINTRDTVAQGLLQGVETAMSDLALLEEIGFTYSLGAPACYEMWSGRYHILVDGYSVKVYQVEDGIDTRSICSNTVTSSIREALYRMTLKIQESPRHQGLMLEMPVRLRELAITEVLHGVSDPT